MLQTIPINLFRISNPMLGDVVENRRLTAETRGKNNDVRHIVFRYKESMPYLPGQSIGILTPGTNSKNGKPHQPRLYSVASATGGDHRDNQTVSLCVVRHFWENPETGEKEIPGVASNYLCDLKPGQKVKITGPTGKHFLLPEDFKKRSLIFVATGTGIAPYRGMLRDLFDAGYVGKVWLILGVQHGDCTLYDDEFVAWAKKHPNFTYVTAISREQKNPIPQEVPTRNDRMYVQVRIFERRRQLKELLSEPDSVVYMCGLKGMEAGIFPILDKIGAEMGTQGSFVAKLKAEQRLRVEVY
ncbi:MAG: ferredoxin--NADP(+) reductase [Elusimicrobia bacterium]|nr:ferredoxin--NADP(+) reductase [Elusimicrobiota bacterium]